MNVLVFFKATCSDDEEKSLAESEDLRFTYTLAPPPSPPVRGIKISDSNEIGPIQCRINNSSKCCNSYGPRDFGGTRVLRVKIVLYNMQGWILELGARGKHSSYFPYILHLLYQNFNR